MKEAFEKIIERLEELRKLYHESYEVQICTPDKIAYANLYAGVSNAIEIVNQVAEEYSSSEKPNMSEKVTSSDVPDINDGKNDDYIDYSEFNMVDQVELFKAGIKPTHISYGVYEQVAWERDVAIEQLHELGYEFGQKIVSNDGWIPCSERLPEEGEQIIGTFDNGNGHVVVAIDCFFRCLLRRPFPLTAWMPLPEPYKPKEN